MLATIINFSTNEAAFLGHCLKEALLFSDQVIVVVCDHFFDGTPENQPLLNGIYETHPDVEFIQYEWSERGFYSNHPIRFQHNVNRLIGINFLKEQITDILFLDADEIVEGERFKRWLPTHYDAIHLACYWYFREAQYRATEVEDSPLLIKKKHLNYHTLMHPEERRGMHPSPVRFASKKRPFVHHYSWVRTKKQLLRKIRAWGHREERNWEALLEREFSTPFSGTDFVHGYCYQTVAPYLIPSHYSPSSLLSTNCRHISQRELKQIDLKWMLTS